MMDAMIIAAPSAETTSRHVVPMTLSFVVRGTPPCCAGPALERAQARAPTGHALLE